MRSSSSVVNERLLHAHRATLVKDLSVLAGRLPVALSGGAVRPRAVGVFSVSGAEEVPF